MATHATGPRPRSPLEAEVIRLARTSAPRAVARLAEQMECDEPSASIRACELVLHYSVGKPREEPASLASFSNEDLLAEVNRRERLAADAARASDSTMAAGAADS